PPRKRRYAKESRERQVEMGFQQALDLVQHSCRVPSIEPLAGRAGPPLTHFGVSRANAQSTERLDHQDWTTLVRHLPIHLPRIAAQNAVRRCDARTRPRAGVAP